MLYRGDIDSSSGNIGLYDGSSFIRNLPLDLRFQQAMDSGLINRSISDPFYLNGLPASAWVDPARLKNPVQRKGNGPAVNIKGLSEAKKIYPSKTPGRGGALRSSQLEIQLNQ